jgi:hypothetical protein
MARAVTVSAQLAAAATVSGQLDLAGWDTAYLHELRGKHGEWVKNLPEGRKQATFPGMPRGSRPPDWEEAGRKLTADMARGVRSETSPRAKRHAAGVDDYMGNSADTSVVTFSNGHKWVRKRDLPESEMDNEVLTSRVSSAIGAGAPPVILRDDPSTPGGRGKEMWEPYLANAKPAIVWEGGQDEDGYPLNEDHDPEDMYNTDGGVRIGVLDNLVNNEDRHEGNWMVARDRKTGEESPRPIDHGRVTFRDTSQYGAGAFGEYVRGNPEMLGDIPQATWNDWRGKLGALQDSFGQMGRDADYQQMMANFESMEQAAAEHRS